MSVSEESAVEPKFVPKVQCRKKCFDIVDKCCMKIIEKSETGDNWNKILEREMGLTKIKYPFLSEKQIRGKALQKLGIPNFMGDIVRFGADKVTGNLAKELNLVTVKKEPRVPPPFKYCRKPHVGTIKKEMKKPVQTPILLPQDSPTRSESSDTLIDENRNVTSGKSKATDTTRQSPKRVFKFTPNFFRKRSQSRKSASEDELNTPRKVPKMAREDTSDWKGYVTDSPPERSPLDNGGNNNQNVDKPQGKLKIECENVIYSQLSETSRRQLLGNSPWSTPRGGVIREVYDDDRQIFSPNPSDNAQNPDLFVPSKSPINTEFFSPPIFLETQTKRRHKKKAPPKNYPQNASDRVINPMFKARRNLKNEWKNDNEDEMANNIFRGIRKVSLTSPNAVINQQLSYPYSRNHSDCVIPPPGTSSQSNNSMVSHLGKENRPNDFPQNNITTPVMNVQFQLPQYSGNNWDNAGLDRQILGEIHQPSNSVRVPFRNKHFHFSHIEEEPASSQILNVHVPVSQLKSSIEEAKCLPLFIASPLDDEKSQISSPPSNIPDNEKENLQSQKSHGKMHFPRKEENPSNVDVSGTFPQLMSQKKLSVSSSISPNAGEYIPEENLPIIRESLPSLEIPTQSTSSMSPLSTDNSENPWLNLTSQDFTQGHHSYSKSCPSQDSGQASLDPLASQRSFISITSESESDDDGDNNRVLSLMEMLNVKLSTIQKNVERIISWLESED